jgi:hypothetical protein
MIQEKELNTRAAGVYAWAAAQDAERYSDECRMRYTPAQRARAETFRDLVEMAYTNVRAEPTYRKKFIVVKVEHGRVRDRKMAQEIDAIVAERKYEKTFTPQGFNFRIIF